MRGEPTPLWEDGAHPSRSWSRHTPHIDVTSPGSSQAAVTMAALRPLTGAWDELLEADGTPRPAATELVNHLRTLGTAELQARQDLADLDILAMGITFTVYSDGRGIDRAWPLDVVPRIIDADEWERHRGRADAAAARPQRLHRRPLQRAAHRRATACSRPSCSTTAPNYRPECRGVHPAFGVWAHISGSDLVRDADGTMYVLEDNLRVPSGVSYLLENRLISKRAFADLFERQNVLPVDGYTAELSKLLTSIAPHRDGVEPCVVVLTPGIFNSAYFEHSFLAQRMGVELVEGRDLFVAADDCVYMRTIGGPQRVDVIYRRIDDLFLDPEAFRPDSALGRARAGAGVAGRQRGHRQRARRRRGRRQGRVRLGARHHPVLRGRRAAPAQRADVALPLPRGAAVRGRQHRRPRREAGQRERRLRHPHRQPGHHATSWTSASPPSRPIPGTGWPNRSCRCRRRPRCATAGWSRATSTCGRSS